MYNYIKKWKRRCKKNVVKTLKWKTLGHLKMRLFLQCFQVKQKTHNDYVIDKSVNGNKLRVLPMTVIYGANACGKSNIVLAMDILKKWL